MSIPNQNPTVLDGSSIINDNYDELDEVVIEGYDDPIKKLDKNPYTIGGLRYPLNISDTNRQHSMFFYINEQEPVSYKKAFEPLTNNLTAVKKGFDITKDWALDALDSIGAKLNSSIDGTGKGIFDKNTFDGVSKNLDSIFDSMTTLEFIRPTKRLSSHIQLYMPDTLNFNYGYNWNDISLTDLLGIYGLMGQTLGSGLNSGVSEYLSSKSLSGAIGKLGSVAGMAEFLGTLGNGSRLGTGAGDLRDFGMYVSGYGLNPQLQVLFKGMEFRRFTFEFIFAPTSNAEANEVEKIIKTFKKYSAPRIADGNMGRYYIPPATFDIEFYFGKDINSKIPAISTCVIENIMEDDAPQGFSTFRDGMPIQKRLILQMKETQILDRDKIEKYGY